jgi:hypothetical protein
LTPRTKESAEDIVHRRNFIAGIPAIWLTAATAPAHAIKQDPSIDEAIEDLVRRLQAFHGGQWACKHDSEMLMMRRV